MEAHNNKSITTKYFKMKIKSIAKYSQNKTKTITGRNTAKRNFVKKLKQ